MSNITLRQVQVNDNPYLSQIIKKTFEEFGAPKEGTVYSDPTTNHLFELFKEPNAVLWVACVEDEMVGCCGIYPTPNLPNHYTELVKFYIKETARGKGIGNQLLQQCIQSAKAFGYTHIYLECTPQFTAALKLYNGYGFTLIPNALGNSGHGGCSIFMVKAI